MADGRVVASPYWNAAAWASALGLFLLIFVSNWGLVGAADPDPETKCNANNASCGSCLSTPHCYWCSSDNSCHHYEYLKAGTYFKYCSWSEARWHSCWLNVEALVISLCVLGGILLVSLCYCYCVCRSKCNRRRARRMERAEEMEAERDAQRESRNAERSADRRSKADQIRQKYGIRSPDGPNYEELENERT